MDEHGRFTAEVPTVGRHARVRRQHARSSGTSRTRGVVVRHDTLRPLLPALLALRRAARLPGDQLVVRRRSPRSATAWSSSTSRSTGCPSTSRTAASASGWRTPATGRSAATASGARRSRCGRATIPTYPRIDVYGSLAELERDFGVTVDRPAPPVRRRADAAQPRRPDRAVDDAARPRGARLLVRVGLDAVRPGALPVREPRLVREPLSRATSSSSTSARRAAGSTRCTCWRRRCSTGRRSATASATASCSATTGRRCRRACDNYPDPMRCSTPTAPTRCAGTCCRRRSCAAATCPSPRAGIRETRAPGAAAAVEHAGTSSRCTPTPPAQPGVVRTDSTDALDRYILGQDRTTWSTTSPRRWTRTTCSARARRCATFLDALTNWYVRRSRDRFWAGDQDAIDTLHTVLDDAVPGGRAAAAADDRGDLPRPDRRRRSVHLTDWPDAAPLPADPALVDGDGPGARRLLARRLRVRKANGPAGPPAAADADRSPPPDADASGAVRRAHRRRGQRQGRRADRRRRRGRRASSCTVVPSALGPRLGKDVQKVIKAVKRATGRATTPPCRRPAASSCSEGEYSLRARRRATGAGGDAAGEHGVVVLDTDAHAGARGRRPGPRPRAPRAAGPPRRRAARQRPHRPAARASRFGSALRSSRSRP